MSQEGHRITSCRGELGLGAAVVAVGCDQRDRDRDLDQ